MNTKFKQVLIILCLLLITQVSCNNLTIAGFWRNYQKQFIQLQDTDQGPWGGHRKIIWESAETNSFAKEQVIQYASTNGWQLSDSLIVVNDSVVILTNYNKTNGLSPMGGVV